MNEQDGQVFSRFVEAIDEAVALLDSPAVDEDVRDLVESESLPSLLEQCRNLVAEADAEQAEIIRTVHHFACTGGTLIAKCLASMPNTHLLSEVDPLSELGYSSKVKFRPADLVGLVRFGSQKVDEGLLIDIFLRGLSAVYENAQRKGMRLILRDHAHSQFCVGPDIQQRPSLREMLNDRYHTRSIITVRHPIDSWLSLLNNKWVNFEPGTVDEYARRYLAFLDHYQECEIYRYEDFVSEPVDVMRDICFALDLPFTESFEDVFLVHSLSGDSGRMSHLIERRPRRGIPPSVRVQVAESIAFQKLLRKLGYEFEDDNRASGLKD